MSDTTEDIRHVFGRFAAGLGVAAAAAAALTGLSYVAGSVYLDSFLSRFGAAWALDVVSTPVRISAGWWMVATAAGLGVLVFGDAFNKLPRPDIVLIIARRSDYLAALAYFCSVVIYSWLGDTRSGILGQLIANVVVAFFVMIKVAALTDLSIAGLSKPDPFTIKWLASYVAWLAVFAFLIFPAMAGQVRGLYHLRLDLKALPMAEVQDVNSAVPRKCRVILATEERLLCVDPALFASRKPFAAAVPVQVIPWASVRTMYH